MHYLIDGHNLVGKMPDINLDDPDDEVELVLRLRSWSARGRKRQVTVIFDRGLPGGVEKGLSSGMVKVIFAPSGRSADSLLINRIRKVKNAAEYTLVSSDLRVMRAAQERRMPVWRSEIFVARLEQEGEQRAKTTTADMADDPQISAGEVEMWMEMFTSNLDEPEGS